MTMSEKLCISSYQQPRSRNVELYVGTNRMDQKRQRLTPTAILSTVVTTARPSRHPALIVGRFIQLNPLSDRSAQRPLLSRPCRNHIPTPRRLVSTTRPVDVDTSAFSSRRETSSAYRSVQYGCRCRRWWH